MPAMSGSLTPSSVTIAWLPLTTDRSVPGRRRSRGRSTGAVIRSRLIRSLRASISS